jgi:radical SAM protein with 4Fe4S-binding SPASM domain
MVNVIAAELGRAGVLMLEIGYPGADDIRGGLLRSAVERAAGRTSLALLPETIERLGGEEPWREMGVGEVWADVTPGGEDGEGKITLPRRPDGSVWPDLRIYLTSNNLENSAALIVEAVQGGAGKLSLPILPLFGRFLTSAGKLIPPWRDLVKFAHRLDPLLKSRPDLDLRIHYQSLWTILTSLGHKAAGAEAPGHSGCQAAAALAYIDPSGVLYPCASLPLPLGRVDEGALGRAWKNEELTRLREAIGTEPPACDGCSSWQSCRGGCRGWAHYLTGSWEEAGPDCGREVIEQGSLP